MSLRNEPARSTKNQAPVTAGQLFFRVEGGLAPSTKKSAENLALRGLQRVGDRQIEGWKVAGIA